MHRFVVTPTPQDQLAYELSCPICLQLYSDPVVLPCGHNYCRACICKTVDALDKKAKTILRCPECREEYRSVDSLQKNFKLCSIVEGYQAAAQQLDPQTVAENMKEQAAYEALGDKLINKAATLVENMASLVDR
uniref:RING-type domain-containing protein n=1 Tax=Mastacembelus armatus TaxID=205130 RepID=A0A7N8X9K3_9TELE